MAKYESLPTIIEAEQWFPGKDIEGVVYKGGDLAVCVTIHGQQTDIAPGDYIITEPNGVNHYPCKPELFEKRYRPIEETESKDKVKAETKTSGNQVFPKG